MLRTESLSIKIVTPTQLIFDVHVCIKIDQINITILPTFLLALRPINIARTVSKQTFY